MIDDAVDGFCNSVSCGLHEIGRKRLIVSNVVAGEIVEIVTGEFPL